VSLGSIEKTVVTDIRDGVQNAINWLTTVAETHLPAAEADIKAVAGNPITKAIEAAFLSPAEEAWAADIIAKIPSLRSQPAAPAGTPEESGAGDVPSDQSAA
jgi:hypothetical protein